MSMKCHIFAMFSTGLPSSVCVVDCAINGFTGVQISISKGDALTTGGPNKGCVQCMQRVY